MNPKIQALQEGKSITTSEKGNSMIPLIHSGQKHVLSPMSNWEECQIGDIVFCRVHGRLFTHLVKAKNNERGLQIGNNHGYINGWTKTVYGKVTEVL